MANSQFTLNEALVGLDFLHSPTSNKSLIYDIMILGFLDIKIRFKWEENVVERKRRKTSSFL